MVRARSGGGSESYPGKGLVGPPPLEAWWEDARLAAPRLIGSELVHVVRGRIRRGRIVETEAYLEDDPASHSFRGETTRNRAMFGPPGRAYVYRIHQVVCFNIVTGPPGRGEAVLIRALEPIEGAKAMFRARARARARAGASPRLRARDGYDLTNGPGKLCQALGITMRHDGRDLEPAPDTGIGTGLEEPACPPGLSLVLRAPVEGISRTARIGISQARERPLRFLETGSPWVSRGRPRTGQGD